MPDPEKYKEAASKLFRSILMGHPTTAQHIEGAMQRHLSNTAAPMKKAPLIFPEFIVTVNTTPGWSQYILTV